MFAALKVLKYRKAEESAFALRCMGIFYVYNVFAIYGGFHHPCIHCNGVCEPFGKDFKQRFSGYPPFLYPHKCFK